MLQVAEENGASAEVGKNVNILKEPEEPAVSELEAWGALRNTDMFEFHWIPVKCVNPNLATTSNSREMMGFSKKPWWVLGTHRGSGSFLVFGC